MADTREQSAGGSAPIDPVPEFRGGVGPGVRDAQPVKVDMGLGPPTIRRQPERSGMANGAAVVLSAALALLFGGAGAWAYQRFVSPAIAEGSAAPKTQAQDSEIQKNLAHLDDRIEGLSKQCNGLSDQYKQLQARLESMPKPTARAELASLAEKVAHVDGLTQQVEAIRKQLDPLPEQIGQFGHKITELEGKLEEQHHQASALREQAPAGGRPEGASSRADRASPGEETETTSSASEKGATADSTFEFGLSQFRQKKYKEAYDVFRRILQSHREDARVWYYAALSYGLGTGDWGRMTESMVEEGLSREKAGRPQKSAIDSAVAGLTKETGQDWLAFYRRRVQN
jgi:chaperonin cofactor prefoldin